MNVQTSLNFYGRTEEAIQFYSRAIGAETLFLLRFRDRPDKAPVPPGLEDKIFHATFRIGSTVILACLVMEMRSISIISSTSLDRSTASAVA